MINEVSKPLSYHVPVEKICEKLKKKDSQICELRYGKEEHAVASFEGTRTGAGDVLHPPRFTKGVFNREASTAIWKVLKY